MKNRKIPKILRIFISAVVFGWSLAAFGTGMAGAWVFSLQLEPLMAKLFAAFTLSSLWLLLLLLLSTFLFGRFYCAALCPLGILQDIVCALTFRKGKRSEPEKNYRRLRYFIVLLTVGSLIGGSALFFRLLAPFSNFGAIAETTFLPLYAWIHNFLFPGDPLGIRPLDAAALLTGLLPLVILLFLVIWKRRIFCNTLCPVGGILGLCSRKSVFSLRIEAESCIHCKRCEKWCPAGCINVSEATLDNERCLRCMNCVSVCSPGAIRYGIAKKSDCESRIPGNPSRRRFLADTALLLAAFGSGVALGKSRTQKKESSGSNSSQGAIVPPGAGSPERFENKCTACRLCIANCKGNVLRSGNSKHQSVHLDFDQGMCEFNCIECIRVCPTGALMPMTLKAKQRCRIGLAVFNPSICVAVLDETDCGACAEHCPTGALRMKENKSGIRIPVLTEDLCIGCGNCEYPCPVRPEKAIRVLPVPIQVTAVSPEEFFKHSEKNSGKTDSNQDWLI